MQIKISGRLVYNGNAEYEIHTYNNQIYNISEILTNIDCLSNHVFLQGKEKPYIKLLVEGIICDIVNERGFLYKAVDSDGLFDWHINSVPVGKRLFYHVDELLKIVIDVEGLGEEYDTKESIL